MGMRLIASKFKGGNICSYIIHAETVCRVAAPCPFPSLSDVAVHSTELEQYGAKEVEQRGSERRRWEELHAKHVVCSREET